MVSLAGVKPAMLAMSSEGARKSQEMKATNAFQCIVKSVIHTSHEEDENNESDMDEKRTWQRSIYVKENCQHVAHLRRKLEVPGGIPMAQLYA